MAKITLSPGIASVSGRLNDDYYFRTTGGQTYICHMPKRSARGARPSPPSAAQRSQQERFRRAQQAVRIAMENPEMRAYFDRQWSESNGHGKRETLRGFIFRLMYR